MVKVMRMVRRCDFCEAEEPTRTIAECYICGQHCCFSHHKILNVEGLGFTTDGYREVTGYALCQEHFTRAVEAKTEALRRMGFGREVQPHG